MIILGSIQFDSESKARNAGYTTSLVDLAAQCNVKQRCYLYVSNENKIVAVQIDKDAYPSDEVMEIGYYDPRG